MKRKVLNLTLAFVISLSLLSPAFAAETITKTYKFNPTSKEDLTYNAPKEIKEGDKTYVLDEDSEIKYKITKDNKVKVKKNVRVKNKEDIKKEEKHKTDKGYVILKLKEGDKGIEWKSIYRSPKVMTREYANKGEIPNSLSSTVNEEGKTINVTCNRSDIKTKSKVVSFSAPAKFYGYPDSNVFSFKGKKVKITGKNPTWSGYKSDVSKYLGDKGSYNITNARWSGAMKPYQDMYVREARFTGTKTVPFYEATYIESDATRGMYEATVTYEGVDSNQKIEAEAMVQYKLLDKGLTTLQKILIAAGVLVLISAIILILFILKKRRKENVNI